MSWERTLADLKSEVMDVIDSEYERGVAETEVKYDKTIDELNEEIERLKSELEELQEKYDVLEMEFEDYKNRETE